MKKLLILGCGQYASVVKEVAESLGIYEKIAFLDDRHGDGITVFRHETVGKISDISNFSGIYTDAFPAIGNSEARLCALFKIKNAGFVLPTLISPRAYVSPSASVFEGVLIEPFASVNANATVKTGTYISLGAVVNHDSYVGECSHIDCNSVVAAGASVPDGTKVMQCTVFSKK